MTAASDFEEPDSLLLARYIRTRDEAAFAQLARRHSGAIFATCYRILGNRVAAEDAAQETFLRLVRKPEAVAQSVGGWLHRAATTVSIDMVRKNGSEERRRAGYAEGKTVEASEWNEISPLIDEALAELPDDQQSLLVEHFIVGRTQRDLAAAHDTSLATVSRRVQAALEALRGQLRKKGVTVGLAALTGLLLANVADAAPMALARELGKLAMVSGGSKSAAAATSAAAGDLVKIGIVGLCGLAAFVVIALGLAQLIKPDPLSKESKAGVLSRVVTGVPAKAKFVRLPEPAGRIEAALETDRVAMFQDPATSEGGLVILVFRDNHVSSLSTAEATKLIEKQTGKPMAEVMRGAVYAEP